MKNDSSLDSIAVVIPTCNRADGLKRALKSLGSQTVPPNEVIVVDDSPEQNVNSVEIMSNFSNLELTILYTGGRKGANYARNMGIRDAGSKYISLLDDDDEFAPNKIKSIKDILLHQNCIDVIYNTAKILMPSQGVNYVTSSYDISESLEPLSTLLMGNVIGGSSMVTINRVSCLSIGAFDEKMPALQDIDLWIRCAMHGKKFYFIKEPLTIYEQNTEASITTTRKFDAISEARKLIDIKYSHFYSPKMFRIIENKRCQADVMRHMLNGNTFRALQTAAIGSLRYTSFRLFAMGVAASFGQKFFFKIRERLH